MLKYLTFLLAVLTSFLLSFLRNKICQKFRALDISKPEKIFLQKMTNYHVKEKLLTYFKNLFQKYQLQQQLVFLTYACRSSTLLEKQSKFPRENMKCREKPDTIPRCITLPPLHFMLYRGKSIFFGTVYKSGIGPTVTFFLCPN